MKTISVVIPAYNAEKFIRKAVESAIQFPEVAEVILVEDGSPDNTLAECKLLEHEYEKIKLYLHPENVNKGAGASRNLGIKKATSEYIAFLDADDYYLPIRFDAERKILFNDEKIDGIYGAIDTIYYSLDAKVNFEKQSHKELLTVKNKFKPEELKYALIGMSKNYFGSAFFHLDSLTVKKSLIEKIEYFNEKLRLHQDTDFIIKLALMGSLVPGIIDTPIGSRGIHGDNRITSKDFGIDSRYLLFSELEKWLNNNIVEEEKVKRFVKKEKTIWQELRLKDNIKSKIRRLVNLSRNEPYLLYLEREFERLVKGVFGDKFLIKIMNKLKVIIFRLIYSKRIDYWNQYFYDQ